MNVSHTHDKIPASAILMQACDWQARLWADDTNEAEHQACLNWRNAHPDHERAWQILNCSAESVAMQLAHYQPHQSKKTASLWVKSCLWLFTLISMVSVVLAIVLN